MQELEYIRQRIYTLEDRITALSTVQVTHTNKKLSDAEDEISSVKNDISSIEQKIKEVSSKIEGEISTTKGDISSTNTKIKEISDKITEEANMKTGDLSKEIKNIASKIDLLATKITKLENAKPLIQRVTEVVNQPIVHNNTTEVVKEVAVTDEPNVIIEKIESQEGDERLDYKALKNTPPQYLPPIRSFRDLLDVNMTGVEDGQAPIYDAASGSFKPGSAGSSLNQNTCALMGDSRSTIYSVLGIQNKQLLSSIFVATNQLMKQRFKYTSLGVSGAGIQAVIDTQLPQLVALDPTPAYTFLIIGINDFTSDLTADYEITRLNTLVDGILATGTTLVALTDLPGNLTTKQQIQQQVFNSYLLQLQYSKPRMITVDAYATMLGTVADGTAGRQLTSLTSDTVHPNCSGSFNIAREMFDVLDPLVPKYNNVTKQTAGYSQMIINPNLEGDNASGSGKWTADTGITGNGPNHAVVGRTGTATATTSMIARTGNRTGKYLSINATIGSIGDTVYYAPGQLFIPAVSLQSWSPSLACYPEYRIRPTVANGYQYLVTSESGSFSAGADPTAGWSTTLGNTVTDGGVTMLVVPSIDIGDTVYATAEILGSSLVGKGGAYITLDFYTSGFVAIATTNCGFFRNDVYGFPNYLPAKQTLSSQPFVIPAGTAFLDAKIGISGESGTTLTIGIDSFEIRKLNH